ncbi:hypothetical protein GCM10010187_01830 [Actinomadura coerulea]|nr:hypothetical protein GCM10010187_01830 [Actinomadura coerulea]
MPGVQRAPDDLDAGAAGRPEHRELHRVLLGIVWARGVREYFAEGEDAPESFARDLDRPVLTELLP